jgi:hypothetical protein
MFFDIAKGGSISADHYMVHFCLAALAGNYVNFSVFELYGDRSLADALDVALQMTLSIPLADVLTFRKVWTLALTYMVF